MIQFREGPSIGFDPAIPWLMVGEGDVQYVELQDGKNAQLSLQGGKSASPFAAIDSDFPVPGANLRVIGIRGLRPGTDVLTASLPAGGGAVNLAIDVLPERKLSLWFYRLRDEAGHKTHRTVPDAAAMRDGAHFIHFNQDRVGLVCQGHQDVVLPGDLGDRPRTSVLFKLLLRLFLKEKLNRHAAQFHVFLVWDMVDDLGFEPDPAPDPDEDPEPGGLKLPFGLPIPSTTHPLGVTNAKMRSCLIRDFPGNGADEVLAHEIGHFLTPNLLGAQGHSNNKDNLMRAVGLGGIKLTRDQCRMMNDRAARVHS